MNCIIRNEWQAATEHHIYVKLISSSVNLCIIKHELVCKLIIRLVQNEWSLKDFNIKSGKCDSSDNTPMYKYGLVLK